LDKTYLILEDGEIYAETNSFEEAKKYLYEAAFDGGLEHFEVYECTYKKLSPADVVAKDTLESLGYNEEDWTIVEEVIE